MNENYRIPQGEMLERYKRAAEVDHLYINGHTDLNANVSPNWLACGKKFWYRRKDSKAVSFILVDTEIAEKKPAFDHKQLAQALSASTGEKCSAIDLPISIKSINETGITFSAFERDWNFTVSGKLSEKKIEKKSVLPAHWRLSADGKTALYLKDFNLWVHDIKTGMDRALTTDGVKHYSYAAEPESRSLTGDLDWYSPDLIPIYFPSPKADEALWSPDGKKIFTYQLDERSVKTVPTMSYVPLGDDIRPRVVERKFPMAGDKHVPTYRFVILDVETGEETAIAHAPVDDSFLCFGPVSGNRCWWSSDNSKVYFLNMTRGQKSVSVVEADATTGACRVLFEDRSDTYLEMGPTFEVPTLIKPLPETRELIWISYRSGYPHLYLYDLESGKLKNPITQGDWAVYDILSIDTQARDIFITIMGRNEDRDFYYRELVRVNIDSGEMTMIVSGDFDVLSSTQRFAADNSCVVVTYSRADTPQKTELRDRSGNVIMPLEEADLSRLPDGWEWPEPFEVMAEDGVTRLYGTMYKPTNFDPGKKYPVLDFGPWNYFGATGHPGYSLPPYGRAEMAQSIAQLGIIVVSIIGRSGGFREKSNRDYGYDNFWEMGAPRDHVAGVKELARRHSYIDLDRVGAIDLDCNGPVCGLMEYPEFYKVAIAHTLYDPRMTKQGEVFSGITDEKRRREYQTWDDRVHNLKGKLLIITGLADLWFIPSMTFQLTDLLLRANKDFDHYVHPNGGHMGRCVFARRRVLDYLARHLVGGEPPEDFVHFSSLQLAIPCVWPEVALTE